MILVTAPAGSSFYSRWSGVVLTFPCVLSTPVAVSASWWPWATYNGDGVLTDVLEPNILDGAATAEAVDAFALVLADYHVAQGCAGAENEDGVSLAWAASVSFLSQSPHFPCFIEDSAWASM
jgi:hypothetical protein